MKRLIGYAAALCLLAMTVGCGGVTNTGTLAYVSNSTGTGFTVFNVNTDGSLTKSSISPQNTPAAPKVIQFTANGKWAYFLDAAGTNIYGYVRSGNGQLGAAVPGSPYPVSGAASSLVITPNSNFVYVALPNALKGELSVFAIDAATGQLSGSSPTLVGYPISQLVMAPGGSTMLGLSPTKQAILGFTLNASSGAVTQGSVTPVGLDPRYMILSANGSYLYVPDFSQTSTVVNSVTGALGQSPNIYAYNVAAGGTLTQMAGSPFTEKASKATGLFPKNPVTGATSNDTRYLFIANQGTHDISVFRIATTSGEPTEIPAQTAILNGTTTTVQSPFDCGSGCTTPSFLAVVNANNALYLLDTPAGKIFQFAINQNTGIIRALAQPSVAAEANPTWITIR